MKSAAVLRATVEPLEGRTLLTAAGPWSLAGNFTPDQNPNANWEYGYRAAVASTALTPMDSNGVFSNISFWYHALGPPSGGGLPSIGWNGTSTVQGQLPPGAVMMHPGDTAAIADLVSVARWTAPAAGSYNIASAFTGLDTRGLSVTTYVVENGKTIFSQDVTGQGGTSHFTTTATLTTGETVDFVVGNNGPAGDKQWTEASVTIARAPTIAITPPTKQSAVEGTSKLVTLGSFTALAATPPYKDTINWGDGSTNTTLSLSAAGTIPATAHVFAKAGTLTVSETITDAKGVVSNTATFTDVVTAPLGSISGEVFNDANGDGKVDDGEIGVGGWTVDLYSGSKLLETEVTPVDGDYSFANLAAGTYEVKIVPIAGIETTTPTGGTLTITLKAGQASAGNLFGERAIA